MSSLLTAGVVFGCALVASLLGMLVARGLPEHHLSGESRDTVKLGLGVIATLTALVLGLLVASAKSTYDAQDSAVKHLATNFSLLNRYLGAYGPETKEARDLLHNVATATVEQLWPDGSARGGDLAVGATRDLGNHLYTKIAELQPKTDAQRALRSRAMDLTTDMAQTRYRLYAQSQSPVPLPFLVVLVLWFVTLFAGYGLVAPRNPTVVVVLAVCALSNAAALFLVLELGHPFAGVIQVPSAPLREALAQFVK